MLTRRVPFYITTPIYYVNAEPHLGHAYTTIAADILARHMRQRGEDVFFLTGTDEHGEPVAQAAEKLGLDPARARRPQRAPLPADGRADRGLERLLHPHHRPRHMRRVQEVIQRVYDNGHVYEGTYEGWYCPRCADFKTESELGPGNTCPIHKIPLEREREENWFFRLSAFQEQLERLYAERPDCRPRLPRQRGAVVHPGRLARRLAVAAEAELGRAAAVGPRAGDVRVVRRAAQLRHRAQLRPRGGGPDRALLAGTSTSSARTSSSSTPSTGPRF